MSKKYDYLDNEIKICLRNTITDYDDNEIEVSKEAFEFFYNLVSKIKVILDCSTEIINGDLDRLPSNLVTNGINVEKGKLIIIDNRVIDWAYNFKLVDSMIETICHEIAHNRYWNHTRWHKNLTEQYFKAVKASLSEL